jgi:hypothetical protein
MKYLAVIVFSFYCNIAFNQSNHSIGFLARGGRMSTGFGDQRGDDLSLGLLFNIQKFSFSLIYGKGTAATSAFSLNEYKNTPNLFVADEYYQNYPGLIFTSVYEIGNKNYEPKTDFSIYSYWRLGVRRNFKVYKKIYINLGTFVGVERIKRTYITGIYDATVKLSFAQPYKGTITSPLLHNFRSYTYGLDLGIEIKVYKDIFLGPYITWSESDIRWFTLGLGLRYNVPK